MAVSDIRSRLSGGEEIYLALYENRPTCPWESLVVSALCIVLGLAYHRSWSDAGLVMIGLGVGPGLYVRYYRNMRRWRRAMAVAGKLMHYDER